MWPIFDTLDSWPIRADLPQRQKLPVLEKPKDTDGKTHNLLFAYPQKFSDRYWKLGLWLNLEALAANNPCAKTLRIALKKAIRDSSGKPYVIG